MTTEEMIARVEDMQLTANDESCEFLAKVAAKLRAGEEVAYTLRLHRPDSAALEQWEAAR